MTYIHYKKWEGYQAGMYAKPSKDSETLIELSIKLFSDPYKLKLAMQRVVIEWPLETMHNLANGGLNRRSWLGQSACFIDHGIPEIINRNAWNALTDEQRKEANKVADEVIKQWELDYEKILRN